MRSAALVDDEMGPLDDVVLARGDDLWRTAWLLTGDAGVAEDLVQTVLATAPVGDRAAAGSEPDLRRALLRTYASRRRRRSDGERAPEGAPDTVTPVRPGTSAPDAGRRDLLPALAALGRGQRAVVVLRFHEDLTEKQAADALGVGVGTVARRTSRALTALRAEHGPADADRTTDEEWLRRALAASVPEPPATDRLDEVRERRRRAAHRRTVLVGAGAALAVAVAAATPILLHQPEPPEVSTASEVHDPVYDGPACPAAHARRSGPSSIPAHPVSVRLCPGTGTPIDAPRDALVGGAERVAAAVDALGPLPAYPACADEPGPGYRLLFAYADGSTATASGRLSGCRPVAVGSTVHQGADTPLDTFVGLLAGQRSRGSPRARWETPTCASGTGLPPLSLVATPTETVAAVFCPPDSDGDRDGDGVAVEDGELATILADRPRRAPDLGAADCTTVREWRIVGTTAWGDRTQVRGDCLRYFDGFGGRTHTVGPDVRQILVRLQRQATSQ